MGSVPIETSRKTLGRVTVAAMADLQLSPKFRRLRWFRWMLIEQRDPTMEAWNKNVGYKRDKRHYQDFWDFFL
jgi:hypothetical protein